MASPVPIPPAAMSGREVARRTAGIRQSVVVSSRPLCPPASKPSATIASTPASSHLTANRELLTTWTTVMPCSFRNGVHFLGLPAEVKTIFTPSSTIRFIRFSISGYIKGTLTPKGLSVAVRHFRICSRNTSGCMEPAPNNPSPPALLTAEASRQPLHQTIPPCIIGYLIPNNLHILFMANLFIMLGEQSKIKLTYLCVSDSINNVDIN